MKANMFGIFVILSFTLISCSRDFKSIKIVENRSAYNLKVTLYNLNGLKEWVISKSFLINSKASSTVVDINSSSGLFYNEGECARKDMDSIVVEIVGNSTLKVVKDFTSDANWTSKKDAGSRKTEIECRTVISDSDIVPK